MRGIRLGVPLLALALLGTSCNGAKEDCEGTLKSYEACINDQDFDCIVKLVHPKHREKFGDAAVRKWAVSTWTGVFDLKFEGTTADKSWDVCIIKTTATYQETGKKSGQKYSKEAEVFNFLPAKGGMWYLGLPGAGKL